jgi:PKD repeat protein
LADQASGVSTSTHRIYVLAPSSVGWGGLAYMPGSQAWINGSNWNWQDAYCHEFGHNIGMHHATAGGSEYADHSDPMGNGSNPPHTNGAHTIQMGWATNGSVTNITTKGTYTFTLNALELNTSSTQIITLPKADTTDTYYISYRAPIGMDAGNLEGGYNFGTSVHHYSSGSNWTYLQGVFMDGNTYADATNNIFVTQTSHTSTTANITVKYGVTTPPPTVATAASASPNPVTTGTTTALSVLGADVDGEATLTYTWAATAGPAPVTFSANGTNAAKNCTATFSAAGNYTLQATIRDIETQTVTSTVAVVVNQTLTAAGVTPPNGAVVPNGTLQFNASLNDQFGKPMASQPTFGWSVSGGGTISASGLYTAGGAVGGPFTVTATGGGKTATGTVTITNGAIATYVTTDAATQGNWKGVYGIDGSAIENDSTNYPAYATVTMTNAIAYSGWASSTSDVRAPLKYASTTDRIASCWYSGSGVGTTFSIDVNLTDNLMHRVAIYSLDWDSTTRAETFEIDDANLGTVLDGPRPLANFNGGDYVVWDIKGHVIIKLVCTGGYNAVVSGIFFGYNSGSGLPVITSAATATPNPALIGQNVAFAVAASDADGDTLSYSWTFGDGGTGTGSSSNHTYSAAGTYSATATVNDGHGNTVTSSVNVVVNAPPPPVITSSLTASGTVGSAFTYTITASNSPTSFNASGLPVGLSVNTTNGVISGTPTATGTSNVTISATNGTGTGSATLVLMVTNGLVLYWKLDETSGAVAADSSGAGNPGTLMNGGTWTTGKVGGGLKLNGTSQYVVTSNNMSSQFAGGSVTIALWFNASAAGVIVDELGQQTLNSNWHDSQLEVMSDGSVYARVWNMTSVLLGKVTLGQWAHVALRYDNAAQKLDGFLNGIQSATSVTGAKQWPGALYYALGANDSTNLGSGAFLNGMVDDLHIYNRPLSAAEVAALASTGVSAPSITSPLAASGTVGSPFSYTITATNTPTGYNASGLPAGLNVVASTGVISGTPTAAGTSNVTISATNAGGTGSATLVLTINAVPPPPVITSALTASGTVGSPFSYTITASNGPASFNATGLPGGLSVNTASGVISGTPTAAGTSNVALSATNAGGTGTATLVLTVSTATKTVHVSAIAMSLSTTAKGKAATAKVTIVDNNNVTVGSATIAGTWTGLTSASVSGNTGSNGTVKFTTSRTKTTGKFTFTVTNVTKAGYTYAPGDNVVTTASIDTSGNVTVSAPSVMAVESLGTVQVYHAFKLNLPLPDDISAAGAKTKAIKLPSGMRVGGALISGNAKQTGTFTFTVRFLAKSTAADSSGASVPAVIQTERKYSLTVKP